jgi:hypothetical protein
MVPIRSRSTLRSVEVNLTSSAEPMRRHRTLSPSAWYSAARSACSMRLRAREDHGVPSEFPSPVPGNRDGQSASRWLTCFNRHFGACG